MAGNHVTESIFSILETRNNIGYTSYLFFAWGVLTSNFENASVICEWNI
jgi:hypothetical protein